MRRDVVARRPDAGLGGVHWARVSREPHVARPPIAGDLEVDLAVVGGGYTGLSIARAAAEEGASVAVFEAGRIGNGASGRNGGFVVPHFPGPIRVSDVVAILGRRKGEALAALVTEGPDRVMALVRRYQIAADAEANGWIQPAHSERSAAKVRAVFEDWRAFGAPVRWLGREEIRRQTGSSTYLAGWTRANGAMVNPAALARGLARAAANAGVLLFEGSTVEAVADDGGRPVLTVNGHRVRARTMALATNGHTGGLLPGAERSLIPVNLFHTFTAPLPEETRARIMPERVPFTDIRKSGGFARYDRDGRLISGGAVFALAKGPRADIAHARRRMADIFPDLGEPPIEAWWHGYCATTDNNLPRVQRLAPGVFSLAGYMTRGVSMSINAGEALGRVLGGRGTLEDVPLEVAEGPVTVRLQPFKARAARLVFPVFAAMDRAGLS